MPIPKISLILACTLDGGIGYDNKIPWYIPSDLRKFKTITTKCKHKNKINAVIMGRKTWESLNKPLANRLNIVVTSNPYYKVNDDNVTVTHSVIAAIHCAKKAYVENVFVIGGTDIYNLFLESEIYYSLIDKLYLSVLFYDNYMATNKKINIDSIFHKFKLFKDPAYKSESDNREFASYICVPTLQKYLT